MEAAGGAQPQNVRNQPGGAGDLAEDRVQQQPAAIQDVLRRVLITLLGRLFEVDIVQRSFHPGQLPVGTETVTHDNRFPEVLLR